MQKIIKRDGKLQDYSRSKLYASLYLAGQTFGVIELAALKQVFFSLEHWLGHKHEVTSQDLRWQGYKRLRIRLPRLADFYLYHKDIS